jgi:hypothetical protein
VLRAPAADNPAEAGRRYLAAPRAAWTGAAGFRPLCGSQRLHPRAVTVSVVGVCFIPARFATIGNAIEADGAAVASFATRPGLALVAGGLPVIADGQVAGGVGIAGAMTGAEDRAIAEAAVAAVSG